MTGSVAAECSDNADRLCPQRLQVSSSPTHRRVSTASQQEMRIVRTPWTHSALNSPTGKPTRAPRRSVPQMGTISLLPLVHPLCKLLRPQHVHPPTLREDAHARTSLQLLALGRHAALADAVFLAGAAGLFVVARGAGIVLLPVWAAELLLFGNARALVVDVWLACPVAATGVEDVFDVAHRVGAVVEADVLAEDLRGLVSLVVVAESLVLGRRVSGSGSGPASCPSALPASAVSPSFKSPISSTGRTRSPQAC